MTARTALAGLLALAFAPVFWPGDAAAHTCDDPFSTNLIADQKIDAGDVKVCNDDATLTITYGATFPWCLLKTDLHVATIPAQPADPDANIPQNRPGNPIPDQFAYGDKYGGCLDGKAVFEIPLDEIGGVEPGDTVAIAAHAEVEDGARTEGAWGEGTRFVARGNWAMYFTYVVQAPPPPTSCVCDSRTGTGGTTGAAILAQLCPAGELAAGVVFVDVTGQVGPLNTAPQTLSYTTLILGGSSFCSPQDEVGFASAIPIMSSEGEACRPHLRASCGQ